MENTNENPVVEENTETPVAEETPEVIETPVVEEPVVEEPVAEAPVVETPVIEEPVVEEHKEEPTAISTNDLARSTAEREVVGSVNNGAIGVTSAPAPKPTKKSKSNKQAEETVAIRSTKNVSWSEVGKVYVGINIVSKSAAEKWMTRSHISLATPEEVAKEFGK